jgi:hypothetical protein
MSFRRRVIELALNYALVQAASLTVDNVDFGIDDSSILQPMLEALNISEVMSVVLVPSIITMKDLPSRRSSNSVGASSANDPADEYSNDAIAIGHTFTLP